MDGFLLDTWAHEASSLWILLWAWAWGDSAGCDLSEEMLVHCVCPHKLVLHGKLRDLLGKNWSNLLIWVSGALRTAKHW